MNLRPRAAAVILNENNDPLYEEVKSFVIETRKASTSLIQRKFSIGYARAARLMDTLEDYMDDFTKQMEEMMRDSDCAEERNTIKRYIDKIKNLS